ncbi:MAG: DUF4397 domain-containing protein [Ferrimonas sp.]
MTFISRFFFVVTAFTLAACDNETNSNQPYIQVLHAAADAPLVTVLLDDATLLEDLDYLDGSAAVRLDEGSYTITVEAQLPDDTLSSVIGPVSLDAATEMQYAVLAVGSVSDDTLTHLLIDRSTEAVTSGNARVQVVHAAASAPAVDVYVTTPDADISSSTATLTDVSYEDISDALEITAGEYQIRITTTGTTTVVFDSGTLTLASRSNLILAATDNTLAGDSPVLLVVWSDDGSVVIPDVDAGSDLRAVHASPNAPEIDVIVNDTTELSDVAYTTVSDYLSLSSGSNTIEVVESSDTSNVLIDVTDDLVNGLSYTLLAINDLDDIAPWLLLENRRTVATEAALELLHASPTAGAVDIYLGTDDDITDESPAFSGVTIGQSTGRIALSAGDYYVTITETGSQTAAIGPTAITLEADKIYTAAARDNDGGGLPLGLIYMDDFVTSD